MIEVRYDFFVIVPEGFYRAFSIMPNTIFVSLSDYEKLKDDPAYIENLKPIAQDTINGRTKHGHD